MDQYDSMVSKLEEKMADVGVSLRQMVDKLMRSYNSGLVPLVPERVIADPGSDPDYAPIEVTRVDGISALSHEWSSLLLQCCGRRVETSVTFARVVTLCRKRG